MKSFFERLALLIHWIGFVVIVGGVVVGLWFVYIEYGEYTTGYSYLYPLSYPGFNDAQEAELFRERVVELLVNTVVAVVIGLFFWVLKWLISGNKSLWPWKSSE